MPCRRARRVWQRNRANDHQRETSWSRHASSRSCEREQADQEGRTNRNMGASSCPSNGGTVEKGAAGAEEAGAEAGDAKRIRAIVHENNKNKRMSHVQNGMESLMQHDEWELLSVWEGWHWDDNKGGWLDPELCAKTRRQEVECIRRHKMYTSVP